MSKLLFTWNLSPLQSSKFSFEYLLLPPRSAPPTGPFRFTPKLLPDRSAHLLVEPEQVTTVGYKLHGKRHPFSGPIHSAGELLHTP